jgi:epoxyqueuosine reductase
MSETHEYSLRQAIEAQARSLGFDLFGVTTPDPPPHIEVFARWLEAGRHGEMGYLAKEETVRRRADPRLILEDCQSILVLGVLYPASQDRDRSRDPKTGSAKGRVASYAWGDDYHEVLPKRLQALMRFIEKRVGRLVSNRWYTDTGPILERELAQRAGLGWIGKNTCLINPHYGSYFLLCEVLLGLVLEPDTPFLADRCGSCTRCLEACPTQCILPDRTIEARRCISYLTIELKDEIPENLRSQLGDWVFGCDVCQQVCPWNFRFAPADGDPAFAPRPTVPEPDLIEELSLSPEEFNRKFRKNPVKRAKRSGYLRNVVTALGGGRVSEAIETLGAALDDPERLVRLHAAWALGVIGGPDSAGFLAAASEMEEDPAVQEELRKALQRLPGMAGG